MKRLSQRSRVILFFLTAAVFAAAVCVSAVCASLNLEEHHYALIAKNMPIFEVRRTLKGKFRESDITLARIEKEGWSLGHLVSPKEKTLYAKKYAFLGLDCFSFHIIYGKDDRVRLKIPAFE